MLQTFLAVRCAAPSSFSRPARAGRKEERQRRGGVDSGQFAAINNLHRYCFVVVVVVAVSCGCCLLLSLSAVEMDGEGEGWRGGGAIHPTIRE